VPLQKEAFYYNYSKELNTRRNIKGILIISELYYLKGRFIKGRRLVI
jgi:hypothetical protein